MAALEMMIATSLKIGVRGQGVRIQESGEVIFHFFRCGQLLVGGCLENRLLAQRGVAQVGKLEG